MSYVQKETISINGSTAAVVQTNSSSIRGFILGVRYEPATLPLSSARLITIRKGTTAGEIPFKFMAPSSGKSWYPTMPLHTSTSATIGSTAGRSKVPLAQEILKVGVTAATSANKKNGTLHVYWSM